MSAPSEDQIQREICAFIASLLGRPCEPHADLRAIGVDSIAFLELVIFIEKRFKVPLPLELITASHLSTVQSLTAHLVALSSPNTQA